MFLTATFKCFNNCVTLCNTAVFYSWKTTVQVLSSAGHSKHITVE